MRWHPSEAWWFGGSASRGPYLQDDAKPTLPAGKATAQVWVGARWNQSWFDDAPGLDVSWNRDMRRFDLAVGYRHTAHLEVKAQYSLSDQAGREIDDEHLFAAQWVLWLSRC